MYTNNMDSKDVSDVWTAASMSGIFYFCGKGTVRQRKRSRPLTSSRKCGALVLWISRAGSRSVRIRIMIMNEIYVSSFIQDIMGGGNHLCHEGGYRISEGVADRSLL